GSVDETFVAMGLGQACTAGVGACVRYGSQRCNASQNGLVCSAVAGTATAELCNQVDDNCDGSVDEPFKTGAMALGNVCTAGLGATGTGAGNYPCKSIGVGLTRATATGRVQILVADGTYNEGVTLVAGKQLRGGYRADTWERHLTTTSTVISGSTQSGNNDR